MLAIYFMPLPGPRPSWWDDAHPQCINGQLAQGGETVQLTKSSSTTFKSKVAVEANPNGEKDPRQGWERHFDDPCDHQYYAVTLTTRTSALQLWSNTV